MLPAFLCHTTQQPVRSGTVTAFACQTVGFLSLSLSLCLWCNAVFSALSAALAGALQMLEKNEGVALQSLPNCPQLLFLLLGGPS